MSIFTPASRHHPTELPVTAKQGPQLAEGYKTRRILQRNHTSSSAPTQQKGRAKSPVQISARIYATTHFLIIFPSSCLSKHSPAHQLIERLRHHFPTLSYHIWSPSEAGNLEEPRQTTRVCSSVSFSFLILISFFIFLLDLFWSFLFFSHLLAFLLFRRNHFPYFSPVTRSMRRLEALEERHESFFLFCVLCFVFCVFC